VPFSFNVAPQRGIKNSPKIPCFRARWCSAGACAAILKIVLVLVLEHAESKDEKTRNNINSRK